MFARQFIVKLSEFILKVCPAY